MHTSDPDQDEMVYGKCDVCDRMKSVDRYTYVCNSCEHAENERAEAEYLTRQDILLDSIRDNA
jgi:hypothetical protein